MRAGLYARVSTHDQQTLGLRSEAMATYIKNRGWVATRRIEEVLHLKAERVSHSEIARRLGIGRTSVRRIIEEAG